MSITGHEVLLIDEKVLYRSGACLIVLVKKRRTAPSWPCLGRTLVTMAWRAGHYVSLIWLTDYTSITAISATNKPTFMMYMGIVTRFCSYLSAGTEFISNFSMSSDARQCNVQCYS